MPEINTKQKFYDRTWKIRIGDKDVTDLDFSCKVMRTSGPEPNKAELTVYNLSRDSLNKIKGEDLLNIQINLGHKSYGEPFLCFIGDVEKQASASKTTTETVLKVIAKDGARLTKNRTNRSYTPGVPISQVINDLIDDMGVGRGNADEVINEFVADLSTNASTFEQGVNFNMRAVEAFDALIRSRGYRWSVQNNGLQFYRRQRTIQRPATVISSTSGLIGSPARDKKGKVSLTVVIQPNLEPGKLVRLKSAFIEGDYEIQQSEYVASSFGSNPPWFCNLLLKPLAG